MDTRTLLRKSLVAKGQVQSVGFRPFIYRLARKHALTGFVGNTAEGVVMEVQGNAVELSAFLKAIHTQLPPLAVLTSITHTDLPLHEGEKDFHIVRSTGSGAHCVLISPDAALCNDCHTDMEDKENRRHNYPFTNCTNCGPRYTITRNIPYDRHTTSMGCFPMCDACRAEYENPLDRRFHAQPNACPTCGPRLWFVRKSTAMLKAMHDITDHATNKRIFITSDTHSDALKATAEALRQGDIVAIKGLGGFHICCDATQSASVARIREKKCRPHKALAVMVPDMLTARRIARISDEEQALLLSSEKPIVLCRRLDGQEDAAQTRTAPLPYNIAPDTQSIGLMLPYTPLHMALFQAYTALKVPLPALVMTSGNAAGEPICLGNREAVRRLSPFVDAFLLHDRDILVRTDDSVCAAYNKGDAWNDEGNSQTEDEGNSQTEDEGNSQNENENNSQCHTIFYRRARGYVPRPVSVPAPHDAHGAPVVLGMGAELKSTLCLTRYTAGDEHAAAFLSQHIGTLHNLETFAFYKEVLAHLEMLLQVEPSVIVHDLHPNFLSTQLAKELAQELRIPCLPLQHHVAHGYSVLAENGHTGKALVLALDGTGLGDDGTIWGGELLLLHLEEGYQRRVGRLSPFLMPGAEKAIQEPWRLAVALAAQTSQEEAVNARFRDLGISETALHAVNEMTARGVNCLETSSAGRLFDAIAAGLGLCTQISYEGQAAIRLEGIQSTMPIPRHTSQQCILPRKVGNLWELSSCDLFQETMDMATQNSASQNDRAQAAQFFHRELSRGFALMAAHVAHEHDIHTVALTGGVMHNKSILHILIQTLEEYNLRILTHRHVPTGDGGIALGQSIWGLWHSAKM